MTTYNADPVCQNSDLVLVKDEVLALTDANANVLSTLEWDFMVFLLVFCLLWAVANLSVFFSYKRFYQRTRVRVGCFVFLYCLGIICFVIGLVLPLVVGIARMPCWVSFVFTTASVGCFFATNFTRSSAFMLMTRLAVATYDFGRIPIDETTMAEERQKNLSFLMRSKEELLLMWFALTLFFKPSTINHEMTREEQVETLLALRLITSRHGSCLFAVICLLPWLTISMIILACIPAFNQGCYGCKTNNIATVITVACLGGVGTLNAVLFTVKCRTFPDAWGVFKEGRLSAIGIVIALIGYLLQGFLPNIPDQQLFTLMVGFGFCLGFFMVTTLQVYLASKKEQIYVVSHRSSRLYAKGGKAQNKSSLQESGHQNSGRFSLSTISPVADLKYPKLNDVLSNPALTRAFEYHLSTEFSAENLCFLQDVWDWMQTYNDISKTAATARAKKLINTYIADKGLYQINISSEMAKPLLKLSNDNGPGFNISNKTSPARSPAVSVSSVSDVTPASSRAEYYHPSGSVVEIIPRNVFEAARNEIANLLEIGSIPRFMSTKEYASLTSGDLVAQHFNNNSEA